MIVLKDGRELSDSEILQLHAQGIWVTGDGLPLPLKDLSDKHLANIIARIERIAASEIQRNQKFYSECIPPWGDGAEYQFDLEVEYWQDLTKEELASEMSPFYELALDEQRHRRDLKLLKVLNLPETSKS